MDKQWLSPTLLTQLAAFNYSQSQKISSDFLFVHGGHPSEYGVPFFKGKVKQAEDLTF
jgi:hypothetical protein